MTNLTDHLYANIDLLLEVERDMDSETDIEIYAELALEWGMIKDEIDLLVERIAEI